TGPRRCTHADLTSFEEWLAAIDDEHRAEFKQHLSAAESDPAVTLAIEKKIKEKREQALYWRVRITWLRTFVGKTEPQVRALVKLPDAASDAPPPIIAMPEATPEKRAPAVASQSSEVY